jgi:signal transduction histidine kinase
MTYSRLRIAIIAAAIIATSLLHYFTPLHLHYLHDIYQRFYYIPIILAALWFGFRGGLATAVAVSIVYTPHILFQWGGHMVMEMEKYLEIVLYNIVGCLTGLLSQRERERSDELQKTAAGLEESCRELQRQSEQIIAVEEQLRRTEKLSTLGELAAVLAHEIRNPLGSIRGTAEILKDDYRPGDPKYEFIEIQIKETERLNRVVEEFLRMAHPRQEAEMGRTPVGPELETIITLTAADAKKRGIALELSQADTDLAVRGDGEKLRQAFLNIVINALQSTPAGGRVTIKAARAGANCAIRFSDSGPGMDEATLARIFDPFFTTKPDGTGLGLPITKKIIEGHGGTIEIESTIGKGTTVIVRLPDIMNPGAGGRAPEVNNDKAVPVSAGTP